MTQRTWNIDTTHSSIEFSVRHMMFTKVRGRFSDWSAELDLDENNLEKSSVRVTIDASSIDTRNEKRDAHLRSPDFFDIESFPTLSFASTRVEKKGSNLLITGNLTIHGETREVVLEAERTGQGQDPWGNIRLGFAADTKISRKDFGLTWNQALETGGVLVGDAITISLEVQAMAQAQPALTESTGSEAAATA